MRAYAKLANNVSADEVARKVVEAAEIALKAAAPLVTVIGREVSMNPQPVFVLSEAAEDARIPSEPNEGQPVESPVLKEAICDRFAAAVMV